MDLRRLRYFAAVARAGSFSRAAEELRVAQPALSRRIAEFEAELGKPLLVRHGRGIRLTAEGAAVLQRAEEIQRLVRELESEARRGSELRGTITLAVPPSAGLQLVPPVIRAFADVAPGIVVRVREGVSSLIQEWLAEGRVDVGVVYNALPIEGLRIVPLLRERMVLVGPPAGREGPETPVSVNVRDMTEIPLIMPSLPHNNRRVLEQAAARHGLTLTIVSEVDSVAITKALVASGQGFTVLTYASVKAEIDRGELTARNIDRPTIAATLSQMAPRSTQMSPAHSVLMATIERTVVNIAERGFWPGAEAV